MITPDFIVLFGLAILIGAFAIFLLIYGIYCALSDKDISFSIGMIICFLCLSALSVVVFNEARKEYKNAIPQNQIKILKRKISDAEKEYQKYLIDHPELKELSEIKE